MKYGHFDFVFLVCTRDICLFWQRDPSSVAPGFIFFLSGEFFLTQIYALGTKDAICFTNDKQRMSPLIPPL